MLEVQTSALSNVYEFRATADAEDASPEFLGQVASDAFIELFGLAEENHDALDWNNIDIQIRPAADVPDKVFVLVRVNVIR